MRVPLRRLTLILAMLLMMPAIADSAEPTERDLEYARVADRKLQLDFYRAGTEGMPLVVWIHGGAWRAGSKSSVPVTAWIQHGFSIASIDYRLSPEAPFPAQVQDINAAIRFLRANADRFGVDPDRFVIAGASAGGHLAALVGVASGVSELEGELGDHDRVSSRVQAIVSFYGASNLQSILSQSTDHGLSVRVPALQLLLGGQPQDVPKIAKLASPVAHVDAEDPPLWLIHGDEDPQMPFEQSAELSKAYQILHLPVQLDVVKGGKHGGKAFYTEERVSEIAFKLRATLSKSSQ
ncbi:MAG: alpha/beta hydrolase fold domain-containing protein [Rubripirellula sp.]